MRRVPFILASLLVGSVGLAGCSSSEPSPAAAEGQGSSLGRSLDGTPSVEMLTEHTAELVVRYRDENGGSVAGIQVDFVLMSGAPGASLWPSRAYTDAQGTVRTQLRAGSLPTTLRVRASALDAAPYYVDVVVRQAAVAAISARVSYAGKRAVDQFLLGAFEGATCAEALALGEPDDAAETIATRDAAAGFSLDAGSTAALVGWALDVTGAPVARGCVEVTAPESEPDTAARMAVTVPLADLPIALREPLALPLALDVSTSAARLDETVRATVGAQLTAAASAPASAEADYYLGALARELAATEAAASSGLAAVQTSAATTITAALSQKRTGLRAWAAALGQLLSTRGSRLSIEGRYARDASVVLEALTAVSSDGMLASALSVAPALTLRSARFDEARAALDLDGLELRLGLGQYGRALLSSLPKSEAAAGALRAAAGCVDALTPALSGMCTPQAIARACDRALVELTSAVDTALAALDAAAPAITLAGSASVHDRTSDGAADDLGAGTLAGTWGRDALTVELDRPAHVVLQN